MLLAESLVDKLKQKTRFANSRVSDDDVLEEVVVRHDGILQEKNNNQLGRFNWSARNNPSDKKRAWNRPQFSE
jgi:hypothetical protein